MDRKTFRESLTLLSLSARPTGASAQSADAADAITALWWRKFGGLPDAVLVPAFELALDTCTFFPSVAEFGELVRRVASEHGAAVDGRSAWEACERAIFSRWSEASDRLILANSAGYPWPNPRCKAVLREAMHLTVRQVANLHPKEYSETRERFVALYDQGAQVARAEDAAALPGVVKQLRGAS